MKFSVFSIIVFSIFFFFIRVCNGGKILAILPTAAFSHQQFYRSFLIELHKRGHNLTVATANPINNTNMTDYREIDLGYGYDYLQKFIHEGFGSKKSQRMDPLSFFPVALKIVFTICEKTLADDNLMSLYKNNEKFDLIILEWGINTCFYPFEKLSDGKIIGIASYEIGTLTHLALGNPSNPAYCPDPSLDFTHEMNFSERVSSFLSYVTSFVVQIYIKWKENKIAEKYFGNDMTSSYVTEKKVALVFDNSNPITSYPRPGSVNFIPLGGPPFHLNNRKFKKLSEVSVNNFFFRGVFPPGRTSYHVRNFRGMNE